MERFWRILAFDRYERISAKSIDWSEYRPFAPSNRLVKAECPSEFRFEGKCPKVFCAYALYPFVETAYAITVSPREGNVSRFVDFLVSPEGRELVERTGYAAP